MNPKAAKYIEQLHGARCEGNWDAVPELVRKVRKHAPERTCLTLAAETECAISRVTTAAARSSASQTAQDLDAGSCFPKLSTAIGEENVHHEDRFQAKVCMGWLSWVVGEYSQAIATLPTSLEGEDITPERAATISEWTNLCALKSGYLKANCLMRNGQRAEALAALKSATPSLEGVWCGHGIRKQFRYWSELFLTELCMLSGQAVEHDEINLEDPDSIAGFRAWARYWNVMGAPITGGVGFKGSVPRRRIWAEYYQVLSRILENDLPYAPGHVESISSGLPPRAQLRQEIQRAETAYRALLLSETTFPKADENRLEVEDFVKRVMSNWSILCGRGWKEQDLGAGGRAALSRNVLETLYSAATRTYHSTTILRSLFSVHLALAEFDLAFKAFDSYLDIVKKGKARVEKTGHEEVSLDSDATVLETMAQAVMALCSFGPQQAGTRARQLGAELEDWLSKLPQIRSTDHESSSIMEEGTRNEFKTFVPSRVLALAWQAIGLSHAHWSRITFEASSRTEIQSKAIRCLRKSLAAEYGRSRDIRSFFSLALLLAERRELTAAIELVRSALLSNKGQEGSYSLFHGAHWQERTLIPVWHLLALLLSARQDYHMASRACEGAIEQFKDAAILFGKTDADLHDESPKSNGVDGASEAPASALIDDMTDSEKESILEVKMTQLALIEVMEGPDAAINASSELLSLFSRMFGTFAAETSVNASAPVTPKSSITTKNFRGSLFGGRSDRSAHTATTGQANGGSPVSRKVISPSRRATLNGSSDASGPVPAPAIEVTDENDFDRSRSSRKKSNASQEVRSSSRQRFSLRKRDRSSSRTRTATTNPGPDSQQPTVVDGESYFTPATEEDKPDFFSNLNQAIPAQPSSSSIRSKAVSVQQSHITSSLRSGEANDLSFDLNYGFPSLLPLIQFPKEKVRAQRAALLVKIWLNIAGFYRRAGQLDDGKAAVSEAQKLVARIASDLAQETSESGSTATGAGWAERRSVDDLWGDVWSEFGLLGVAQGTPYSARADFETALDYSLDHPAAIIGLSGILLDIYSEKLLPPPPLSSLNGTEKPAQSMLSSKPPTKGITGNLPSSPLGLGVPLGFSSPASLSNDADPVHSNDELPAPYKATHLPLADRLAARERAFTLLSGLTRLGTAWNSSDAWFALARAHEESGQPEKAKEVLWWCVELEEATGIREWRCLGNGGYII